MDITRLEVSTVLIVVMMVSSMQFLIIYLGIETRRNIWRLRQEVDNLRLEVWAATDHGQTGENHQVDRPRGRTTAGDREFGTQTEGTILLSTRPRRRLEPIFEEGEGRDYQNMGTQL